MSCTSCVVYLSETLLAFIRGLSRHSLRRLIHSRSRLLLGLAVWTTTSGSVSASALSPGPVQVEESIPYPEKMTFIGLSQSIELAASMGLAASAVTRGEVKRYVHDATSQRRNLTPLAVFVREEFADAIRGKGFTPEDNSTTDNRFRLAVRKYGFGMAELVSREVRPLMTLYAELITPDNKVLWSHEAVIRSDDKNLPAILPEQLRTDPDEQEMLLRAAAHRASEKLMENYEGKAKKDHE
jgi:hypothetical protein